MYRAICRSRQKEVINTTDHGQEEELDKPGRTAKQAESIAIHSYRRTHIAIHSYRRTHIAIHS